MASESIFHKLIKTENSYTQLLCNVLKRDESFRKDFLEFLKVRSPGSVKPSHIRAQTRLGDCGQADIRINAPDLCMVIEIKTELGRRLEDSQQPYQVGRGYAKWLEESDKPGADQKLVYLVPAKWKYLDELKKKISNPPQPLLDRPTIMFWERVASLIPNQKDEAAPSTTDDFCLLLDERFGPTKFKKEEVESMYEADFPMETFLKLAKFIDDLRQEFKMQKCDIDIEKNELGFNPKIDGDQQCVFYVGCWLPIWDQTKSPICFGIETSDLSKQSAFAKALKSIYGQEPVSEGDWKVGVVPQKDIALPEAVVHVSNKLRDIFSAVSQHKS